MGSRVVRPGVFQAIERGLTTDIYCSGDYGKRCKQYADARTIRIVRHGPQSGCSAAFQGTQNTHGRCAQTVIVTFAELLLHTGEQYRRLPAEGETRKCSRSELSAALGKHLVVVNQRD